MPRIKFPTEQDAENGFYELLTHGHVKGLPGDTFEVSPEQLAVLDNAEIPYSIVEAEERHNAYASIRDTLAIDL